MRLAVVALPLLLLAGCVDTSFDVCVADASDFPVFVQVWVNATARTDTNVFTGSADPSGVHLVGHFTNREGPYRVDALATFSGTSNGTLAYHGPETTLGAGSRTLNVQVLPSSIQVNQGVSNVVAATTCR
ncbi:MAG: hypothetical protein ACYDBQ_02400 [Thermoplasmatota archaeon]